MLSSLRVGSNKSATATDIESTHGYEVEDIDNLYPPILKVWSFKKASNDDC